MGPYDVTGRVDKSVGQTVILLKSGITIISVSESW